MKISQDYLEEFGNPECYEGKIIEVHHVDGDDNVNNFIDKHANGDGTIKIKITYQEDDNLYGELLDGADFPYHIELQDIGMGSWVI